MSLWTRLPRRFRDGVTGVLPDWWWSWLHDLREVEVDRAWHGARILRSAYPTLAAPAARGDWIGEHELRVYSQNGEDGVIAALLDAIGVTNRQVVEFGIGDGSECCAANLLLTFGWSGLLLEADAEGAAAAQKLFAERRATVVVEHRAVEPDTVDELLSAHVEPVIDVLSLDVDGNDYWIFEALSAVRPRLVVIEYNATFGPERSVTIPYTRGFDRFGAHASGFYHGASLHALTKLASTKGYILAGCDSRGTNAFFVDRDAASAGGVPEASPIAAFRPLFERRHQTLDEQFAVIAQLPLVDV